MTASDCIIILCTTGSLGYPEFVLTKSHRYVITYYTLHIDITLFVITNVLYHFEFLLTSVNTATKFVLARLAVRLTAEVDGQ